MPIKLLIAIPVMAGIGAGVAIYHHREQIQYLIAEGRLSLARLLYAFGDAINPERNSHEHSEFSEEHSLVSLRGRSPSPRRSSSLHETATASGIDTFQQPGLRSRQDAPQPKSTPIDIHPPSRHPSPQTSTPATIRAIPKPLPIPVSAAPKDEAPNPAESGYDTAHSYSTAYSTASASSTPTIHGVQFHNPAFDHINPTADSTGTSFQTAHSTASTYRPDTHFPSEVTMPQPSFESAAYWSVNEWDDGNDMSGDETPDGGRTPGSESGSECGLNMEDFEIASVRSQETEAWSEVGSEVSGDEMHGGAV